MGLRRLRGPHQRRDPARPSRAGRSSRTARPAARRPRTCSRRADRVLDPGRRRAGRRAGRARRARAHQPRARRPLDRVAGARRRASSCSTRPRRACSAPRRACRSIVQLEPTQPAQRPRRTHDDATEPSEHMTSPGRRRRRGPGSGRRRLRRHAAAHRGQPGRPLRPDHRRHRGPAPGGGRGVRPAAAARRAGRRCDARFELAPGRLAVTTTVESPDASEASPDRSGFAWSVLSALASEVDGHGDGGRMVITVDQAPRDRDDVTRVHLARNATDRQAARAARAAARAARRTTRAASGCATSSSSSTCRWSSTSRAGSPAATSR